MTDKFIMLEAAYGEYLRIPIEYARILEDLEFFQRKGESFEKSDRELHMKIVEESCFSDEAIQKNWKKEAERFEDWWMTETRKAQDLQEKIDELTGGSND